MAQKIGYQDGIAGFVAWVRKTSLGLVKYRPVEDRPASLESWYWLEKFERTLRILKDDHDAAIVTPEPPPPPPPPPPAGKRLAPMTHYAAPGADARYCVHWPGVTLGGTADHPYRDEGGFVYTENGLCAGGRSGKFVAALKPANSMDGLEPCQGYTKDGRTFPPWPPESYEV